MIIRQLIARHGRSTISCPIQRSSRAFASEVTHNEPILRPSMKDEQPAPTRSGDHTDLSSTLDQSSLPPTQRTRDVAEKLSNIIQESSSIQASFSSYLSARQSQEQSSELTDEDSVSAEESGFPVSKNSERLDAFYNSKRQQRKLSNLGSSLVNVYEPWNIIDNPPKPDDVTLSMLLANQTHLGHATSLWNPANSSYIFGIREGIHIISLDVTLAYLRRAAKVVREIAYRGGIIVFVGTRKGQQKMIVNAAKLAEGYHIFDHWIAGILTNSQQILGDCGIKAVNSLDQEIEEYRDVLKRMNHPALRPDLVVCLNPLENEACLHECGLHHVPTIGIIDTDANPARVTYPIPANDDSLRSTALIAGALGKAGQEGQEMRREAAKKGYLTYDSISTKKKLGEVTEAMMSKDMNAREEPKAAIQQET